MPGSAFSYRDLVVWIRSMEFVVKIYDATASFPPAELYGLRSQLRRAAVSIPSNVAEGHAGGRTGRYLNHVSIALGSEGEVNTLLEVAARLEVLTPKRAAELLADLGHVRRLLHGLHRELKRKRSRQLAGIRSRRNPDLSSAAIEECPDS